MNECTMSGAASRCSQKAISVPAVSRSGSFMSNRMAKPKIARPQARIEGAVRAAWQLWKKPRSQSHDREQQRAAPRRYSYGHPKAPVVQCRQQHG